jgi:surface carbohydrate biosynthesis protein
MNILIPIETSSRELVYKIYLSRLLALKGHRCYLGRKTQIYSLMGFLKNYIYFDKGYHHGESEKIYKKIKQNNGLIVSLDEEGGVDFEDNSTLLNRYSSQFFNQVDHVFLWGKKQNEIISNNLKNSKIVEVTGHPRFELLKQKYHYLYQNKVKDIKNKYGDFVLINTNMGFGNNIKGDNFVIQNYGERVEKIDQIVSFDKQKLSLFFDLIETLAKKINCNIIVRPHPEECQEIYQKKFNDLDKVFVCSSGSVIPWLMATKQMIHPDCTTAIESYFLGKPAISLLPIDFPRDLVTKLPLTSSIMFNEIDDIIDFIHKPKFSSFNSNFSDLFEDYFAYENNSFDMIVERIMILCNFNKNNLMNISLKNQLYLKVKAFKSKLFSSNQILVNKKLNGFNWETLNNTNLNIELNSNHRKKINLKKINSELFMFSI